MKNLNLVFAPVALRIFFWAVTFYTFADLVYKYFSNAWSYDKLWHFIALFSLTACLLTIEKLKIKYAVRLSFFLAVALEVVQLFVGNHEFGFGDIAANLLGVIAAAYVVDFLKHR